MRGLIFALFTSAVAAQGNTSGCYQESKTAFGNFNAGTRLSDLTILEKLSQHKIHEIKTCTEEDGSLKGLQMTVGVIGSEIVTNKVKLS